MPLTIVRPRANQQFNINTTPRMPTINCEVRFTGGIQTGNPRTAYNWEVEVAENVTRDSCASSRIGTCSQQVQANNVRGRVWTPNFTVIQGGNATIRVSTQQGGNTITASVTVRIRGTNPNTNTVTQRLGGAGTVADYIAAHESSRAQFNRNGEPLEGPGGDVGIMQLCNPAASCLQRWHWQQNVDAGLALLRVKEAAARRYLDRHRVNGNYPNNQGLNNNDVFLREAIQRYNGGTYWTWDAAANLWRMNPPNTYVSRVLP